MRSHALQVCDQIPRGVVLQLGMRCGFAAPALVEQHDPITLRIEELTMIGRDPAAGAAVQKHHRNAVGIAALLDVHGMPIVHGKSVRNVRLYRWIKS